MAEATVNEVITFLKKELEKSNVRIKDIALFGSAMNGERRPGSDIDIIIISDAFKGMDILQRGMMTMDAQLNTQRHFHIPLDVLKKTPTEYRRAIRNLRYKAVIV